MARVIESPNITNAQCAPAYDVYSGVVARLRGDRSGVVFEGDEAALRGAGIIAEDDPIPLRYPGCCNIGGYNGISRMRDGRLRVKFWRVRDGEATRRDRAFRQFLDRVVPDQKHTAGTGS